ncbi:hypothetical protein BaRGS_00033159, partial [Batillaria attramentaria]
VSHYWRHYQCISQAIPPALVISAVHPLSLLLPATAVWVVVTRLAPTCSVWSKARGWGVRAITPIDTVGWDGKDRAKIAAAAKSPLCFETMP